jgi:hypothetical protein
MTNIQDEIAAFKTMQSKLEAEHMGEWILMRDAKVVGFFKTFELAAAEAVRLFGRGPYLIREIGAPPIQLPASVMYFPEASS